jgi:DNA topoisomerase-2
MNTSTSTSDALANKYQKKSDKQHVLDNPNMYIGPVEQIDSNLWILNETGDKIIEKNILYIPGLFKLFDEGVVNCRDHVIRMEKAIRDGIANSVPTSYIDISISESSDSTGTITMVNDGSGIDVVMHPEHKIWVPEMIFGHLRTSTNYDKTEQKIVGGTNGYGIKLVLIWSVYGYIETVDHVRGLKYCQEFKNNLDEICPPIITKSGKTKPYTKIVFKPDYARLGLPEGLSSDMIALLKKRVYDIAAITDKSLKVKYNSQLCPVKNFQQYIDLYIGAKEDSMRVYEENGERWEYAVGLSPSHEFVQVSFVNGIHTSKGGKHVEYILGQITRKLVTFIEKKKKILVNGASIKEQLILFLRCDIENPAFDSQTKDFMNTPSNKFGSACQVTDKFIEKLAKMGIMEAACALTEVKENKIAKKSDGTKSKNVRGIPKLIDANWAGTEKSGQCTIIFCEGDSAKSGIVSGLSSDDRNTIGVYPLKGKLLNVRGENIKKISENKEISEIKKILGLEIEKEYTAASVATCLRYGKVMFMTDQDLDGSHIKGLCINLFQSEWASLIHIPGFIGFMNTPILKAKKGVQELSFYSEGEYQSWKETIENSGTWKVKYYKGLGTSTGKEFKEYFANKKIVGFDYNGETSDNAIDLVFNKKRADDRKDWLGVYDRESIIDTTQKSILYEDFINKEMIHFSKYDCDRSIPNLMDGLKISLRKILFAAFKKNLTTEIKVAQFSGYVSEHSLYHHGEASLNGAIVGMAQNYMGSNNINLLLPLGQFGTRLQNGQDSASERYIFTQLNKITRTIFSQKDDQILKYLSDDGIPVEPIFYAPIVPMVLINGSKGIGTGFSTDIMCYSPTEIIAYLKGKLCGPFADSVADCCCSAPETISKEFAPYYEGFSGQIVKVGEQRYLFRGIYEVVGSDKIRVTELPVGFSTDDFKELLEKLADTSLVDKGGKKIPAIVKDYDDSSTDMKVDFTISLTKGKMEELIAIQLEHGCNGLEKIFKLYNTGSSTNMHLFDAQDKLKKYETVNQIIDDYFVTRLELFLTRKEYLIKEIQKELTLLENKVRYIGELLEGTIDLRRMKKEEIRKMMGEKGYAVLDEDSDFKYLIKLSMDSVSDENVAKLQQDYKQKQQDLADILGKSPETMWLDELIILEQEYAEYKVGRERLMSGVVVDKKKKIVPIKKAGAGAGASAYTGGGAGAYTGGGVKKSKLILDDI